MKALAVRAVIPGLLLFLLLAAGLGFVLAAVILRAGIWVDPGLGG